MEFAKRMERFGESVFSMLAQMKHRRLEEEKKIVDLSIGAPNIPPAPHILKVLSEECLVPDPCYPVFADGPSLCRSSSLLYASEKGKSLPDRFK